MLLFVLILIGVALVLQSWSARHALDKVQARQFSDKRLTEPGASFRLTTVVRNFSRRILPYIRIIDTPPSSVSNEDIEFRDIWDSDWIREKNNAARTVSTYLMPRQVWQRSEEVCLPARGRYIFRGLTLAGGDFLGLSELTETIPQLEEIVVMPAPSEDREALSALGGFFGDRSVRRFIYEDPVLTLGVREYTGREPRKMISWSRSAQLGRLMVKNYDYTMEETADVILNIEIPRGERADAAQESCFSLARSVCELLEEKKIRYRFLTNASAAGAVRIWDKVGDGLGPDHFALIMEGLGRATYFPSCSLSELMENAEKQCEKGRSHILITPLVNDRLRELRQQLDRTAGSETLVLVPSSKGKEAQA